MKTKLTLLSLLILIAAISCKKNDVKEDADNYSPTPVLPAVTDNYAASSNDRLATLGRVLFYDRNLSLNNSVSCGSCHQQSKAFCDNLQFSTGLQDGHTERNTPSIFAKTGRMFWDGRVSSVEDLVLRPIKNHVEMKFENLEALAAKISGLSYYPQLFNNAFGNTFVDSSRIKMALAEFLKNFNFSNNKFSRTEKNMAELTATESLGKTIFFGKGNCSGCHHIEGNNNGPIFDSTHTGYGFTDLNFNIGLDEEYADNGMGVISKISGDDGKFMVPVLLNVEYTAPYMHDGRFKTLEEVVEHYNSGIKDHRNLDFRLRDESTFGPKHLHLSDAEKKGLVSFLKTLSDPTIFSEAKFKNPFTKAN